MSLKRKNSVTSEIFNKKQRKVIDLDCKMRIINAHEAEERVRAIASQFGLAHSTISTILKDKERIKEAARTSRGLRFTILRKRKGLIHRMETLLAIWYDDQVEKGKSVSLLNIQKKARSIFHTLKKLEGSQCTENFIASNGWLQRFRRRFNLNTRNSIYLQTKEKTKEEFMKELDDIIADGHYKPEQIFNVVETSLFWKKIPEAYYPDKNQVHYGFTQDKITLLLGGNTAGFKLKPFFVRNTSNTHSPKKSVKHHNLVDYREEKKGWITSDLYEDWFLNCFVPATMQYCFENKIPNKILLIISQVPWLPQNLDLLHPNVKILYLPKKSRLILEPMTQGAITIFKEYYIITTFAQAIATVKDENTRIRNFWKKFDIPQCIENVASAWKKIDDVYMQGIWKNTLPRFVDDDVQPINQIAEIKLMKKRIIELAKAFIIDVFIKDLESLVGFNEERELTNEELIDIEKQDRLPEYERPPVEVKKTFTVKGLSRVFSKLKSIYSELEAMDENDQRLSNVKRKMNNTFQSYKEIYETMKKDSKSKIKSEPSATSNISSCRKKSVKAEPSA